MRWSDFPFNRIPLVSVCKIDCNLAKSEAERWDRGYSFFQGRCDGRLDQSGWRTAQNR